MNMLCYCQQVHTHFIYNSKVLMRAIDLLEASWKSGNDNVPIEFHRCKFAMQKDKNFNFVQNPNAIQLHLTFNYHFYYLFIYLFFFFFLNDINTYLPIFVLNDKWMKILVYLSFFFLVQKLIF